MATLPGTWRYRACAGTGWPSVSILWQGEMWDKKVWSATSFSVWQHVQLSEHNPSPDIHSHVAGTLSNSQTTTYPCKPHTHPILVAARQPPSSFCESPDQSKLSHIRNNHQSGIKWYMNCTQAPSCYQLLASWKIQQHTLQPTLWQTCWITLCRSLIRSLSLTHTHTHTHTPTKPPMQPYFALSDNYHTFSSQPLISLTWYGSCSTGAKRF